MATKKIELTATQEKGIQERARQSPRISPEVVRCLLIDARLALAREKFAISQPTFRRILEILKMRFAHCYQAYRAHHTSRPTFTFLK